MEKVVIIHFSYLSHCTQTKHTHTTPQVTKWSKKAE